MDILFYDEYKKHLIELLLRCFIEITKSTTKSAIKTISNGVVRKEIENKDSKELPHLQLDFNVNSQDYEVGVPREPYSWKDDKIKYWQEPKYNSEGDLVF